MIPLSGSFQACYIQSPVNSTLKKTSHSFFNSSFKALVSFLEACTIFALLASKCLISSATHLRCFAVTSSSYSFFFFVTSLRLAETLLKACIKAFAWAQLPVHRVTKLSHKQIGEQIVNHSEGFQRNILC